jgi:nucleolar complex protein 3
MAAMGRKRSRSAGTTSNDGGDATKLTRRQKLAATAKTPYFTPKQTSTIQRIDLRIEQLMPQQRIDLIADLSESILEDPITALNSSRTEINSGGSTSKGNLKEEINSQKETLYQKTQSKITKLLDLANLSTNGHDAHAARLALLSLLAIFQDILPSYRIRLPTEAEMSVRVSKETKATWDYERKLLQAYQKFLQLLEKTWEDGKSGLSWNVDDEKRGKHHSRGGGPPTTLAATAILALAALLQTCYNFNFRTNLLQIVMRQANNRSSEEVRSACCNSLSSMFIKDAQGDASLEAVRLLSKMVKQQFTPTSNHSRGSKPIHPDVMNTWLSLPLRVHEDEAIAAKLAAAAKAKKAKKSEKDNQMLEIEKELKEGEATVDKLELARNQTECLHTVTMTYFRILKLVVADQVEVANTEIWGTRNKSEKITASSLELLPCALRGLAKFSHLINLDAMVDLLAVLKDLLKNTSYLPPDIAIHCILCALKTLRGPGSETLPVDPKEYLIPLYNLLPRLVFVTVEQRGHDIHSRHDKTVDAAIQCLDYAFLQRRELSMTRLAAFVKRLASTSLHCPAHLSTPLIASARQISSRYSSSTSSKVARMLENEDDIVAEGMFAPDAEDPEHSNAHATSLWELALLKYHIHPQLAGQAVGMAEGRLLKLPGEVPRKILASMSRDAQEGFISQKAEWKKHPLDALIQNKDVDGYSDSRRKRRQRRSQSQIRFITPRKTGSWHLLPVSHTML